MIDAKHPTIERAINNLWRWQRARKLQTDRSLSPLGVDDAQVHSMLMRLDADLFALSKVPGDEAAKLRQQIEEAMGMGGIEV